METLKETKIIRKKSPVQFWLSFLTLLFILPFYGFFHLLYHKKPDYQGFPEYREAANELRLVGLFAESEELFWRYYETTVRDQEERLRILDQVRNNLVQGGDSVQNMQKLLQVLYMIQALDPQEKVLRYRSDIHSTLQNLGKNRDASNYLRFGSSLQKKRDSTGTGALVVARSSEGEILFSEVEQVLQGSPEEKRQRLSEYIAKKLLVKESLSLMDEADFQEKLRRMVEDFRVSYFLEQKMQRSEVTELELKNHFAANKAIWNYPLGYQISHLLLPEAEGDKFAAAEIYTLEEFSSFAKENSISLDKVKGGLIKDWIETDFIPSVGSLPGLMEFLSGVGVGLVAEPLKDKRGCHYFFVREVRRPRQAEFSDVESEVREHYLNGYRESFMETFFADLFRKNDVVIHYERL